MCVVQIQKNNDFIILCKSLEISNQNHNSSENFGKNNKYKLRLLLIVVNS